MTTKKEFVKVTVDLKRSARMLALVIVERLAAKEVWPDDEIIAAEVEKALDACREATINEVESLIQKDLKFNSSAEEFERVRILRKIRSLRSGGGSRG